MKHAERDELRRQGAKAAARGEAVQCNPMLAQSNRPAVTGEPLPLWSARSAAWQSGFEAQSDVRDAAGAKPPGKTRRAKAPRA
jgi:hypothetical protein